MGLLDILKNNLIFDEYDNDEPYYTSPYSSSDYSIEAIRARSRESQEKREYESKIRDCEFNWRWRKTDYWGSSPKLVMFVNGYPFIEKSDMDSPIFLMSINEDIPFEVATGTPVAYTPYIAHPHLKDVFVPLENHSFIFLQEKMKEFMRLVQSLGASEITIKQINERSEMSTTKTGQAILGELGIGQWMSGSIDNKGSYESQTSEDKSNKLFLYQKFTPNSKPKIPKGLVWYKKEPSWQNLAQQRINGNLTHHQEIIDTRRNQMVSESSMSTIKGDVRLSLANFGISMSYEQEQSYKYHEHVAFFIEVKFNDKESTQINNNEEEYLEQLKSFLEDSEELSERERRILGKYRESLGISEARAIELEKKLVLNEDEKEYLIECKERISEEGIFSDKDRERLNRFKKMLSISDERAKYIESRAK